jgi:hypothetical protein
LAFANEAQHRFGKSSPPQLRLHSNPEHEIRLGADAPAVKEIVRGPMNFAFFVVV